MLIYLAVTTLITFIGGVVLQIGWNLPSPAIVHLVLAVGILPLIIGAVSHFLPVLTRGASAPRLVTHLPVFCQLLGLIVLEFFSGQASVETLLVTASAAFFLVLGFGAWLVVRARRTLGAPHPGWRWYLVAVGFLGLGLALVPGMYLWPSMRQEFRLIHIHLNALGFVGLTAVGTLQVLLPTVLSGPDVEASSRLRSDLLPAAAGVLLTAFGAAFSQTLSIVGAGLLVYVIGRVGLAWWRRYGVATIFADGASVALIAALSGFALLVCFGAVHAYQIVAGRDAILGFFSLFLFPLVTGALSQLLPVWRFPGRQSASRERMRVILVSAGSIRSLLFVLGGILLILGIGPGFWLSGLGILQFLYSVARSFLPIRNTAIE